MRETFHWIAASICGLALAAGGTTAPPEVDCCPGASAADTPVTTAVMPVVALSGEVNRTIPEGAPPAAAWAIPENPTADDIFRSRLFEEPLVPIGGNPSAAENAALGAALAAHTRNDRRSPSGGQDAPSDSAW